MKQLIILLLLVLAVSCSRIVSTKSQSQSKSQSNFQLSTDAAAPGSNIVLKYSIAEKYNPADLAVSFGNEQALLIRSDEDSTLKVMIPQLMPGNCKIFLSLQGKILAADTFTIEALRTQRLSLDYVDNKFKLLSRTDAIHDDNIDNIVADNIIVFEVLDESAKMISAGAFEDPGFTDYESFGKNNEIVREKPGARAQNITFIIPKGKGKYTVNFFQVQQSVSGLRYSQVAQNEEIMKTRKQVDQISFEN
jgi:hypothetical protein